MRPGQEDLTTVAVLRTEGNPFRECGCERENTEDTRGSREKELSLAHLKGGNIWKSFNFIGKRCLGKHSTKIQETERRSTE